MLKSPADHFAPGLRGLLAAAALAASLPAQASLTAHYRLNEIAGTNFTAAAGLDGRLEGSGSSWIPGSLGNCLSVDGNGSGFVEDDPSQKGSGGNNITVSFWVNKADVPQTDNAVLVQKGYADGRTYSFQLRGPDGIQFVRERAQGGSYTQTGPVTLSPDTWYHIAGVYNRNQTDTNDVTGKNTMQLFVNGVSHGSRASSGNLSNSPARFTLGSQDAGSNAFNQRFIGRLDDVGVWNECLPFRKIAALHALGRFEGVALDDPQVDQFVAVFEAQGAIVINGHWWRYTPALGSSTVGASGGNTGVDAYVVMDVSGAGMRTVLPAVQFATAAAARPEATSPAVLQLVLFPPATNTVTVDYLVSGGTATGGGVDYTLAPGTVIFPPGETNQTIFLAIQNDGLIECNETVVVRLNNVTGGVALGLNATHTYSILNPPADLELAIAPHGADLVITWPAEFGQYQLQVCTNLGAAPAWMDMAAPVTLSNCLRQVVVSRADAKSFFRLAQKPPITNSIGMKLVPIPEGIFTMGYWQSGPVPAELTNSPVIGQNLWVDPNGDYDEKPAHPVTIRKPFYLGAYEVTNREYEEFDPGHAALRGKLQFSTNDNEAVLFVSWFEAQAFCDWLSAREGRPYRLPTEAEWEYACRAGTTTHFSTGDSLPGDYIKNAGWSNWPRSGEPAPVTVGTTPANPWGLYDMHGNVEEWCHDWYGPYEAGPQFDPVGRADGLAKVTRGGSHSTWPYFARSENRMGTLPEDRSWYLGFRVVLGELPETEPLPVLPPEPFQTNVSQTVPADILNGPDPNTPYFRGPWKYVKIPENSLGPLYSRHNHDSGGIVECPNGDLLINWYTCVGEKSRELAMAISRLRYGQTNWDDASSFFDMPDRNDHAPGFWYDGDQTLYHFNGLAAAATWNTLALVLRTSTDNGVTWSRPRFIAPEHIPVHQMPISSCLKAASGAIIFSTDAGAESGSGIWKSLDGGQTWFSPSVGRPVPDFTDGSSGAWAAGIHCPIAQLSDGRLIALGRGNDINGKMPKSISADEGTNWTYSASIFPPISTSQRATMLRLREGPLFFASFASSLDITDASGGTTRTVSGLYAAISYDDGVTWPFIRLISDDGPTRPMEGMDGQTFLMGLSNAEPKGYMASTQTRNGVIHLITSRNHYQFNQKWLETRPPAL